MVKPSNDDAKLTGKSKNAVQVVIKIPEAFMKRFDDTSEQLGYMRTEAIKEAMRRFQEANEQKLMQRPENASVMMKEMMSAVFTPILELANKAEESEKLKPKTVEMLSQKDR
jgi:metal-responsive CopG/Arc/MetJ family transcriptional regulator